MDVKSWDVYIKDLPEEGGFLNKVRSCVASIHSILDTKNIPRESKKTRLDDAAFWDMLIAKYSDAAKIKEIQLYWNEFGQYSNVSTQTILQLKYSYFQPLEYFINLQINEWEQELHLEEQFYILLPNTAKIEFKKRALRSLRDLASVFEAWKSDLLVNLKHRSLFYQRFKESRYIDDALYLTIHQLNQLGFGDILTNVENPIMGLDDDSRLMVYDWLVESKMVNSAESKLIKAPINQNAFRPPLVEVHIDNEFVETNAFADEIEQYLQLSAKYKLLYEKKNLEAKKGNVFYRFLINPFINKASSHWLIYFVTIIYDWRSISIPVMSLIAYMLISPALTMMLSLYTGVFLASMLNTLMFYGVALLPAWYFGAKVISGMIQRIQKYLKSEKSTNIMFGVEILRSNSRFIKDYLSVGILDVPHFNVKVLEENVLNRVQELLLIKEKLIKVSMFDWIFLRGEYKEKYHQVLKNIDKQTLDLNNRLNLYAKFIAMRIKDEVQILENNALKNQWNLRIPTQQFKSLHQFVKQYGREEDLQLFNKNTDILEGLSEAILNLKLIYKAPEKRHYPYPWGGHQIHHAAITGWKILASQLIHDEQKYHAVLSLLEMLDAKSICDTVSLRAVLNQVSQNNAEKVFKFIQKILFLTLDKRDSKTVQLLSKEQKNSIKNWYLKSEAEINEAYHFMVQVFKKKNLSMPISDELMARYFYFLEGAEVAQFCLQNQTSNKICNLAKQYFEKYKGEHDSAIHFVRFLPKTEQDKALETIAKNRGDYLINNTNKKFNISLSDIELFKNPVIIKSQYSMNNVVKHHQKYICQYTKETHAALIKLVETGLISRGVLKKYEEINENSNQLMVNTQTIKSNNEGKVVSERQVIRQKNIRKGI